MPLKIAQLGQPVLREMAVEVSPELITNPSTQSFIDEMIEMMRGAKGVGLAAPQVFTSKRIFIADVLPAERGNERGRTEVFINPKLSELSAEKESGWEGCLSFLELSVFVPRHKSLRIDYLDREGKPKALKLAGFPARVVQHEYDHLDGILTIDRATTTKNIIKNSEADDAIEY
jgi:peptide deformylase